MAMRHPSGAALPRCPKAPPLKVDARRASTLAIVTESIPDAPSINARPKRQTMELATQTHLTQLRDLLTGRMQELRAEVHAAGQAQRELTGASVHEVTDRKEEAAQRQLLDLDGAQGQRDFDEMAQVEAALLRLDAGTYGDCADCGEPIPLQRLRVQPAAPRCAPCQSSCEHELNRANP